MTNIAQQMRFVVDVNAGLIVQPQRAVLSKDDAAANRIVVAVVDGKEPADLAGVTAAASFYRPPDGAEVQLEATVEGSEVSALLTDHCYVSDGYYEAKIRLKAGGARRTILAISGYIHVSGSGAVVDVGDVIPSLDALLEQIQATREAAEAASDAAQAARTAAGTAGNAAQAANDAADAANAAAGRAPFIGESGTWFVWNADAGLYMDTGIAATGPTGPKGEQGDTGNDGLTPTIGENGNWFIGGVDTGYPSRGEPGQNGTGSGTVTAVTVNGTKHEPDETGNVNLGTVEAGGSGVPDGGSKGQTLVKQSNTDGDAVWQTLTAADVGARPDSWMPTAEDVGARPDNWMPTAEDVGARPDSWMPTAEDVGAMSSEEILASASYAKNATVTFRKPPDSFDYLFGRLGYAACSFIIGSGSEDARTYSLASINSDGTLVTICVARLIGRQGGTEFTFTTPAKITINLSTGEVKTSNASSMQMGALYGVKK